MKYTRNVAVALATFALGVTPAVALASGHGKSGSAPGKNKTTTTTPNSTQAFGHFCQGESKTHVAGQKGTPFSQCVVALAHANKSPKTSASAACKALSKKHVKGQKGTPFSECVTAVAKLRGKS